MTKLFSSTLQPSSTEGLTTKQTVRGRQVWGPVGKERDLEERWPARIIHLYDGTLWPATPRAQASTFFPTTTHPLSHNSSAGRRGGGREQGLGLELCGCPTPPPPAQQLIRHAELCNHRTFGCTWDVGQCGEMLIPGRCERKKEE